VFGFLEKITIMISLPNQGIYFLHQLTEGSKIRKAMILSPKDDSELREVMKIVLLNKLDNQ